MAASEYIWMPRTWSGYPTRICTARDTTEFVPEPVAQVIDVMEDWFQAIEAGTANKRLPDISGTRYTKEEVDDFIDRIDKFFESELSHHADYHARIGIRTSGVPMNVPPEFNRLRGAAREAFMQALRAKLREVIIPQEGDDAANE